MAGINRTMVESHANRLALSVRVRGLFFLVLGLMFLFSPGGQTAQFALLPSGNAGLSTIRGDMAGLFLGMALFSFLGAVRGRPDCLPSPPAFLASLFSAVY